MITTIARVVLGAILLISGAAKVGQPAALAASIASFHLLSPSVIVAISIILPYFEMLVGLYLVIGLFTRIASIVATLQFMIYGAAIAAAILRKLPADCGCFGPNDHAVADWPHVAFDLALAAIALIIALSGPSPLSLDRRLHVE